MALFDKRSPREIGATHMRLCGQLCHGIDPCSTGLNSPLEQAMGALPVKRIVDFDTNSDAASELIGFWINEGLEKTTPHQRYIFMHSIFRAAVTAGARGHVAVLAGEMAAKELEGLMMTSLRQRNTGFVELTGQMQLEQFGEMLGDYYILAMSKILPFLSSLTAEGATEIDKSTTGIFREMTKEKALRYIAAARSQRAGDGKSIQTLDRYEQMLLRY